MVSPEMESPEVESPEVEPPEVRRWGGGEGGEGGKGGRGSLYQCRQSYLSSWVSKLGFFMVEFQLNVTEV
ncbi:hypothetical protein Tco_1214056 [Tanacetum coccineum]